MCDCCRLCARMVVVVLVRWVVVSSQYDVWFSSLWCDVYLYVGDSNELRISDQRQEIKPMVVNMM